MTHRLTNVRAPLDTDFSSLIPLLCRALRLREAEIAGARLSKKSVDARKKSDVHFVIIIDFELNPGVKLPQNPNLSTLQPKPHTAPSRATLPRRPLVVGFGPAGMMAALTLAEAGLRPIVLERGRDVDQRAVDVNRFWQTGQLDPASNVQFGEGGAGTFSDGKLTTGIKDPRCAQVLRAFQAHGAPEEILYLAKPHIGTDNLPRMVRSIRRRIIELGGEVRFERKLESLILDGGRVVGASVQDTYIETDDVILAVGHSARDTLQMLHGLGIAMRKKPFSIGARIEHSQRMIDVSQYGGFAGHPALGAAEYKLSERLKDGRGAYTFCMCPGGAVVAAASEPGHLVVNGMSAFARDGLNANSALLISVEPGDFPGDSPLSGLRLQEQWEKLAFELGGGAFRAPAQLVGDFLKRQPSSGPADILPSHRPGVTWTDLQRCLPEFAAMGLREAIRAFDQRLKGFASPGAVLTGVETRSSSPVTIPRDERLMANAAGLYPCGEGAGHAGGIVSAAVDGIRCAEALMARYTNEKVK